MKASVFSNPTSGTKLFCSYEQKSWTVREADNEDRWGNGETDGTYAVTDVSVTPGCADSFESVEDIAVGDRVFVVAVTYGTGCTFGSQGGQGQIVAVTKDETLADAAASWASNVRTSGGYFADQAARSDGWPEALGTTPHPSWLGYFEWFQNVSVDSFVVTDEASSYWR
jgi:hypothetical protein